MFVNFRPWEIFKLTISKDLSNIFIGLSSDLYWRRLLSKSISIFSELLKVFSVHCYKCIPENHLEIMRQELRSCLLKVLKTVAESFSQALGDYVSYFATSSTNMKNYKLHLNLQRLLYLCFDRNTRSQKFRLFSKQLEILQVK